MLNWNKDRAPPLLLDCSLAATSMPEHLSGVRNIALILRLAVAKDGHLLHGEFVDAHEQGRGQFRSWPELLAALEKLIAEENDDEVSRPPTSS